MALSLLTLATAGSAARAGERPQLRVFAAASLTEVVEALSVGFEAARVEPVLGGSSALARQIRDGAPADVFLSASAAWIDYLREAGVIADEPIVFARNRLVCIAPRSGPLAAAGVHDPATLLDAIGSGGRVAIADAGVPAGEYARAALSHLGLLDAFERRLVGQRDVRAVLNAVEHGELDAGLVYATDAQVADVEVLFVIDPRAHPPIEYQAVWLRDAANAALARSFLAYLESAAAGSVLTVAGFAGP